LTLGAVALCGNLTLADASDSPVTVAQHQGLVSVPQVQPIRLADDFTVVHPDANDPVSPYLSEELSRLRDRLEVLEAQSLQNQLGDGDSMYSESPAGRMLPKEQQSETPWGTAKSQDRADQKWSTKLGGHVQLDYITWANGDPSIDETQNYFSYRRLRLVADGTGYGQFDYRLQLTLEPGQGAATSIYASADVKDAYLSMNDIPWIGRLRLGNFFVPFSLEQVTNDTNNIFNERSIPTENIFAASRDVGIACYNATENENITWSGGMFFDNISDTVKTRIDDNQGYRLSSRLTWLPYYDEATAGRHLIHTGIGILYTDDHDDIVRFHARPQIQRGPVLIDSGPLHADSYTTSNLEFACVWGSFAVQSEAFWSQIDLAHAESAYATGAYAHASYFITGENRVFERFGQHGPQFGRNKPIHNFFATSGGVGLGAWEAKARWSNLSLRDLNRGEYNDFTFGFNWYWSDRTRWMFDWIHPVTSSQTIVSSTTSDLLAMRFDFNW